MITGNRGEWSEVYAFLKLMYDGKVYAADSELNSLNNIYFPIEKIIREEEKGSVKEYFTGDYISIYLNNKKVKIIENDEFYEEYNFLFKEIKKSKGSSFPIEQTERFMDKILCYKISAPSKHKSDITMKIVDINTGYSPIVGFSIKSELGSPPTLLNAGKTTNFIYRIDNSIPSLRNEVNQIFKSSGSIDVKGRIKKIVENGGRLIFSDVQNCTFKDNLVLLDSSMDKIISETILYFYRDGINSCLDMVRKLETDNPMDYGNVNAYRYKFKKFLTSVALGMKPATIWDGVDEANGGYIIVTKEGDVLAYHIYNRNYFEEYLLKNTKYETASTSRHKFGEVYSEGGEDFIKLNLQIRFK